MAYRAIVALMLVLALAVPIAVSAVDGPARPPADAEVAIVVDVIDGDTIRVERVGGDVERIRYIGMDTPEVEREGQPAEPFAAEAFRANAELVGGEFVTLERDTSDRDQYDRLLRYVWVQQPDGWHMVNAELVSEGLAEVRAYEPDTRHHTWFQQLQREAREDGRGMYRSEDGSDEDRNLIDDLLDFFLGD